MQLLLEFFLFCNFCGLFLKINIEIVCVQSDNFEDFLSRNFYVKQRSFASNKLFYDLNIE